MVKKLKKRKVISLCLAGIVSLSLASVAIAEMISPIDAGVIIRHVIEQRRFNEFEKSLVDLDAKNVIKNGVVLGTKGVILTPEAKKALDDVQKQYDDKNYKAVVELANTTLASNPELDELILYKGKANFFLTNFTAALEDADLYLQKNPKSNQGLVLRSAAYLLLRDYRNAYKDSKKVLNRTDNAKAFVINGLCLLAMKKDQMKALDYANKALKKDPNTHAALLIKAIVLLEEDLDKEALEVSNELVAKSPENPFGYTVRGIARFELGNTTGALEDAQESQKIYSDIAYNYFLLGKIYKQQKENQKSIAALEKAKELFNKFGNFKKAEDAEKMINEIKLN